MTKREIYSELINYFTEAEETDGNIPFYAEVINFATKELESLDRKNEKAKEEAAKRRQETDELLQVVQSVLTDKYQTIADVSSQIEGENVTVAKITYRLTTLVRQGIAEKATVEVETPEGKKRNVMAYRLVGE